MRIIGIDPGRSGGLAALELRPGPTRILWVRRMPWVPTGRKTPDLDVARLTDWLTESDPDLVVLERMQYRPPMGRGAGGRQVPIGAGTAFTEAAIALGYGQLLGMVKVLNHQSRLRYCEIPPNTWQAKLIGKVSHAAGDSYRARQRRTKQAVAAWCRRLYPDAPVTPERCRVPQDGLIDAVALAHYGAVYVLGTLAPPAQSDAI